MIDSPPIWITLRLGRMARTGASVRAITCLSISDSRISGEIDVLRAGRNVVHAARAPIMSSL